MNGKARVWEEPVGADEALAPKFEKAGHKHYSPRVTFQVKSLTAAQRENLRTTLFIMRLLESRVRQAGSIRKAARAMGVSRTFLGSVLRGAKPPGFRLARAVGYIPKVFYMRVLEDPETPDATADPNLHVDKDGSLRDNQDRRGWEKVERAK